MTSLPFRMRLRLPLLLHFAVASVLLLAARPAGAADADAIEKIEVEGNEFMSDEAVVALSDLQPGDKFEKDALQREFMKVWNSGLFEDLRIEEAPGTAGGHVVIFVVREKPRIESVTFEKVKALGQDKIDEVLEKNDAAITANSTFDQERVSKAKRITEEMLASEGYPDARVTVVQRRVARSRVSLEFKMDPGAKVKIQEIDFVGNRVLSDRELKDALQNTKEKGLFTMLSNKTVFYLPRFQEDLQGVRDAYRAKGYLDVEVGDPVLRDARPGKSGKEEVKLVRVEVPVTEGEVYRLSNLTISANKVFTTEELRPLIPLAPGEVLNDSLLKLGLQRIDNRYGDSGYLYATSAPRYTKDAASRTAAVDVQISEGDPYTVRRIEFDGNTRTKDEVLRREMRLTEGELFSRRDYAISTRKIAQLGFWELDGEPTITPVTTPEGEHQVDVVVHGNEVGRNEIQFGGGYSGVDGFFATFSFSSRDFLGRGAQFSVSGQLGGETTRYAIAYVEPYIGNTKGSLGGSIFSRNQDYDSFDRDGKGATVFWSYPTSTFSFVRTSAAWENSKIVGTDPGVQDDEFTTFRIVPSFTFDNRDNPYRPTRGMRFNAGIDLGAAKDEDPNYPAPYAQGNVNFIKPEIGFTQFWRAHKKQYFGIHAEGGFVSPVGGGGAQDPLTSDQIDTPFLPVFERYFLGGERSIRAVQTRSVGPFLQQYRGIGGIHLAPVDCNGDGDTADVELGESAGAECKGLVEDIEIGGDAYWLLNMEYSIPFSQMFEVTGFLDMGNSFGVNHIDLRSLVEERNGDTFVITDSDPFDIKATAGVEFRFHTPVLQQPLRLIYGCQVMGDFNEDDNTCSFSFSIGRTFQ